MKLSTVAKYFNRTGFSDTYSQKALGRGQLSVFEDSVRDGPTTQRRVFEVAPDTARPARGVITIHGEPWVIGMSANDSYDGEVIRTKWIIVKSSGLAEVFTLKQILKDEDPLEAHAGLIWEKTNSEMEISSGKYNQLQFFFDINENVQKDNVVKLGGKLHTVMSVFPATAGHKAAVVEELQSGALETITTEGSTWDPIEEEYTGGSTSTLLRLRWQSDFEYFSQATETFKRGDQQAVTTEALNNGTVLGLSDGDWVVISTQPRNGVQYTHIRRS